MGVDRPLILSSGYGCEDKIEPKKRFLVGYAKRDQKAPTKNTLEKCLKAKLRKICVLLIIMMMMTMCFKHLFSPPPQKTSSPSLPQTSREGLVGLLSFSSSCSSSRLGRRRREDER